MEIKVKHRTRLYNVYSFQTTTCQNEKNSSKPVMSKIAPKGLPSLIRWFNSSVLQSEVKRLKVSEKWFQYLDIYYRQRLFWCGFVQYIVAKEVLPDVIMFL